MRVVIAPDSFKGTIDAPGVAGALATGWRSVRPLDVVIEAPMADGGEGTLDAIAAATPATRVPVRVPGPDDRLVDAVQGIAHAQRVPGGQGLLAGVHGGGQDLVGLVALQADEHGVERAVPAAGG